MTPIIVIKAEIKFGNITVNSSSIICVSFVILATTFPAGKLSKYLIGNF